MKSRKGNHWHQLRLTTSVLAALLVTGCGGGGGDPTPPPTPPPGGGTAALLFAQSHVLPAEGLAWNLADTGQTRLRLVSGKPALALARIPTNGVSSASLEVRQAGSVVDTIPLRPPAQLPGSDTGEAYPGDLWSARLPASLIVPGTDFRVVAPSQTNIVTATPDIGNDSSLGITILPFYLFGATPEQTQSIEDVTTIPESRRDEIWAKWPIAELDVKPHPGEVFSSGSLVIAPRNGDGAYVIESMGQQRDGFAAMSAVLMLLDNIRAANGEAGLALLYYAPIIGLGDDGQYFHPGGGLASLTRDVSVGDSEWSGIFYHELGHNFQLAHAADAFDAGNFPYQNGSLEGSAWGYDLSRNQFLSIFIPSSANGFTNCSQNRITSSDGRCIKQDPMQGGHGDQASGYAFTMMADANAALIQRWLEGGAGRAGRVFMEDDGTYTRWNEASGGRLVFTPSTSEGGRNGFLDGYPQNRDVDVFTIAFTISNTSALGATHIYPPLAYRGNLLRLFDPTNAADRGLIAPTTGTYNDYCLDRGCDYTIRVTYSDGTVLHRIVQGGFRQIGDPQGQVDEFTRDPLDPSSFGTFAMNVPGGKPISHVDLLYTPMAWNGLPADPTILATTRSANNPITPAQK